MGKKVKTHDYKEELLGFDELSGGLKVKLEQYLPRQWKPAGYKSSDNCPVCGHVLRVQIEEFIYAQVPTDLINDYLLERGAGDIPAEKIRKHAQEHCALVMAVRRAGVARYMEELEKRVGHTVNDADLMTAIQKAYMEQGNEIKTADVIRATKVKHDIMGGVKDREMFEALYKAIERSQRGEEPLEGEVVSEEDVDALSIPGPEE